MSYYTISTQLEVVLSFNVIHLLMDVLSTINKYFSLKNISIILLVC